MPASISQSALPGLIAYEAHGSVREALASLGRTEDVRFSPSGTRLAIACYARNRIAVLELELERAPAAGEVSVAVTGVAFLDSPAFAEPHGLDFVDEETLVVASRSGTLAVVRAGDRGGTRTVASIECRLGAAGSVVVRPHASGEAELLVVHNWADAVTRYRFAEGSLEGGEVVLQRWLDLPDGLAASELGDVLAVSNHETHDVLVFGAELDRDADPIAVLRGVTYPHGLRFADDGRLLLVADAGAPYVSVFTRPAGAWTGVSYPERAIRVMDEGTFAAGRYSPQEGGPKGLDLDGRTKVLAVTAEHAPLAFFDLESALQASGARPPDDLVQYELGRLRDLARARAETAEAKAQLGAVLHTKAWRLTSPLRGAYGRLRRRT